MEKKGILQQEINFGSPFPDKLKFAFYADLASLLESGIDIQRSIGILIEEQQNRRVKAILELNLNDLIKGVALSDSMQKTSNYSSYEYQSVKIGEETGRLTYVLKQLAVFFEDKVKLKRQLVAVFTYPTFVLAITVGVLYFMLSSVVPMFQDVFKQFGQDLPLLTQRIIWLSDNFSFIMLIVGVLISGVIIYAFNQRDSKEFKRFITNVILKIPVFGELVRKVYLARMCQSFALLLSSKTPLVNAITLVGEMIEFFPIEEALDEIKNEIQKGGDFHVGLSKFSIFDTRLNSLIKIAEEINQLDTTFDKLTKQYQEDIEYRTKLIGTIVEPGIIVIIGLIVGVIMISMYLPMFNLSNVIK